MDDLEELEKLVKEENDATEEHLRLGREHNAKAAIHFFRLGKRLIEAKAVLGHGGGKVGTFRGWHTRLGVDRNKASRAMRFYVAVGEDGGEDALVAQSYWSALKEYGIIGESKQATEQPRNMWSSDLDYREAKRESGYQPGPKVLMAGTRHAASQSEEQEHEESDLADIVAQIERIIPAQHLHLIDMLKESIRKMVPLRI